MYSTYTNKKNLPEISDFRGLSNFFLTTDIDNWLDEKAREFFLNAGSKNINEAKAQTEMLYKRVEKAKAKWACISAISQRTGKESYRMKGDNLIQSYENLTTIRPIYERSRPITAGRESGQVVYTFSKRSRQRLLSKVRKMKTEGLQLPYFVTLTYQKNMKDFRRAKKDLNAFFQRFRRINKDFRYFWKMEPQKRGSIHFHVAFFCPNGLFPEKWDNENICVEYVRMRVSSAWNEVSRQSENFEPVRSKNGKVFGNMALQSGTNVRKITNWRMFTGYIGKYMKKEVNDNPWKDGKKFINRMEIVNFGEKKAVREAYINHVQFINTNWFEKPIDSMVFHVEKRKKRALHTGRWWGFSYNFDFSEIQSGAVDNYDLETLNQFCNSLNELTFQSITEQLTDNAIRAKEKLSGKSLQRRLTHLRNSYAAQKRRYEINKEKIKLGYYLQFEINHEKTEKIWRQIRYQRLKHCPLLANYYQSEKYLQN